MEERGIDIFDSDIIDDNGVSNLRLFNYLKEDMFVASLQYYNVDKYIYKEIHLKDKDIVDYADFLMEAYFPTCKNYVITDNK